MGVKKDQIVFIGDDVDADILGARQFGIQAIWTFVQHHQSSPQPPFPGPVNAEISCENIPKIFSWEDLFAILGIVS